MKKLPFLCLLAFVLVGCVDTTQTNNGSIDIQQQLSDLKEENNELRAENRELEEQLNAKEIEYQIATDALHQQVNNREEQIDELQEQLSLLDPTVPHSAILETLLNLSLDVFTAYNNQNETFIEMISSEDADYLPISSFYHFTLETLEFRAINLISEDEIDVIFAEVDDKSNVEYLLTFELIDDEWKLANFDIH
ncbi:hypothetical protein [Alkalihalobacillus sp. 1P02AB]|uniref:hypothetical protein n=1 Tax=Alkalihalobacillus sp. 1P02AB TaxID=3132260 RepID=UPI0039A4B827